MRKTTIAISAIVLTAAGWAAMHSWAASGQEVPMTIDQVPEPVRSAILQAAAGAPIREIEQETENGVTVYEAEWLVNGAEHEVEVSADGIVMEMEEEIPLEQAPAAVQAAIAKHMAGGAKITVERKTIVLYEAESNVNGREVEILILPTGAVARDHDDDDGKDESDDDEKGDVDDHDDDR